MLIDSNTHIGHWPFRHRKYGTCETLLGRMDKFGVDRAIVSNLSGCFYKNPQTANEELYHQINSKKHFLDRFVTVGVINPIYGGWRDDFEVCIHEYGMRGIKLYPKYHGYDLTHPDCARLVQMARDENVTVVLSLRVVDSRPSSWLDISEEFTLQDLLPIIKSVPTAKYLIQNVANRIELSEDDVELIRQTNLVMDTSGRSIDKLGHFIHLFGDDKFAFGSHSPVLDYCTGLLRIESLSREEADEDTKEKLRSGNIERLMNLTR